MFLLEDLPSEAILKTFAKKFPEMEVSTTMACLKILKVASLLLRDLEKHFSEYGLSQARFLALIILERENTKQLMPVEIAHKMGTTKKNTARLLAFMEEDGLITIKPHKIDGRATIVKITLKGSQRLNAALPKYYKIMNSMMKNISEKSKSNLIQILNQIETQNKN